MGQTVSPDSEPADGSVAVHRDGAILHLVIDRKARRNSLSAPMVETLVAALTDASTDNALRAIHLRSAGEHFCSGVDWVASNDADAPRPRTGDLVRRLPHTANRVVELLCGIHLPVVCSVRGWAVGMGCNLALAADFTVAADDAVFWEPFLDRGFTPDSGSTWFLPRLVGLARARRMLLLGEKVSGTDAAEWGLIDRCVPASDLAAAADDLLIRLASGPTVALGLAKRALAYSQHATLAQSLEHELFDVELSCRTGDFKEGLTAFRERRTPNFRGR